MTLQLPDDAKTARIVYQLSGPVRRLALRHVPSDWHITDVGVGPDLVASVEELRGRARRQGYVVAPGYTTEDLRSERWGGSRERVDLDDGEADAAS